MKLLKLPLELPVYSEVELHTPTYLIPVTTNEIHDYVHVAILILLFNI